MMFRDGSLVSQLGLRDCGENVHCGPSRVPLRKRISVGGTQAAGHLFSVNAVLNEHLVGKKNVRRLFSFYMYVHEVNQLET